MQRCFGIGDTGITARFGLIPGFADNAIMGLDYGICDGGLPFHGTGGKDGQPPVVGDIAQIMGEVALTLATQTGDTVGRHILQHGRCQAKPL